MNLASLFLSLFVDTKGMDKGLAEAQRKLDAGAKALGQSLLSPIKAALGQIAAGLSLAAITKQYLQQADAIGKMADSIGADMEELQAWGEAAKQAGGSAEAFQGTVQSLTRNLQQAATNAKGPAAQALAELGVKATDATGKARDSFEVLRDLSGVMEGMDKQKAMALGQRVGIDRGTIMLLQSGRAAVDDLINEMKDLGLYTKEDQEIAGKANNAIAKLGLALKSGAAIIMRVVVPAITWITEKAIKVVQFLKKNEPFVTAGIGLIASVLTARLVPALMKVARAQAAAWAPFVLLGSIIAGIALVIDDFWAYMNGGNSALEDLWKTFGEGPELLAKFQKAWETVKTTFLEVFNSAKKKALDFFSYFDGVLPPLVKLFEGVGNIVKGLFNWDFKTLGNGLSQALIGAVGIITEAFSGLWKYITDGIGDISWEGIKTKAKAAWDAVKEMAIGFFEGLPKDAQDKLIRLWDAVKNVFHWEDIKNIFDWESIKTAANEKFTTLWNDIKKIFAWETWATAFADIFKINFEEIGQKISKLFSWEEWKKAFSDIFKIDFDFKNLATALENAFQEAWNWVLEHIPFVKWFIEKGGMAAEAVKETVQGVSKAADKAMEDAGVQDMDELADASVRTYTPTPSDSVSSQAAASTTTNETTNNIKQDDNRTFNFTFNGMTDDPNGFFSVAKNSLSKNPSWMSQSASTMQFGGAS